MDPSNWDDLVSLKPGAAMPAPTEEELNYYLQDYKDFDNLFDEALTTLQDLDVPSGYGQALAPNQRSPHGRTHSRQPSHFKHAKKPSGTAIFGFLDHNRELSLGGAAAGDDITRMMRPPPDTVGLISPTQLARTQPSFSAISNEQLDYNFDQPLEACQPIHLREEDEDEEPPGKETEDFIVTNRNPKSYKFPPEPEPSHDSEKRNFYEFLGSSKPLQPIHYPKQEEVYPDNIDNIDNIDELTGFAGSKLKRYVPIPVHEPAQQVLPVQMMPRNHTLTSSPRARGPMHSLPNRSPYQNAYADQFSPQRQTNGQRYPEMAPPGLAHKTHEYTPEAPLSLNRHVFLPPPSETPLGQTSPEPHSPLPQQLSSPFRYKSMLESPPQAPKRTFYNPQFFSDDAEAYYTHPHSQFSSPGKELPQSSPIRAPHRMHHDVADDTIVDANETILQLTPLKNNVPITPSKNKITLEWSPIISPNSKASKDVRKAIQELSPKRTMKKTSLLPPGELDKYWEGPDSSNNFTCMYKNCGKKFTRRYNVRSHIQTHLSDRPFMCSYCPKSFVRQHDLNRHVKSHMVLKHLRCKCGREFTRIEGFRKHIANGVCLRAVDDSSGGITKPGVHREKGDTVLDGLTSNRLKEELNLAI